MAETQSNDWTIHVGMNLDKVKAGQQSINKIMKLLAKNEELLDKPKPAAQSAGASKLAMYRKQVAVQRQIYNLEKKGVSSAEIAQFQKRLDASTKYNERQLLGIDIRKRENEHLKENIDLTKQAKSTSDSWYKTEKKRQIVGNIINATQRLEGKLGTGADKSVVADYQKRLGAAKDISAINKLEIEFLHKRNALIKEHTAAVRSNLERSKAASLLADPNQTRRQSISTGSLLNTTGRMQTRLSGLPDNEQVRAVMASVSALDQRARQLATSLSQVTSKSQLGRLKVEYADIASQAKIANQNVNDLNRQFGKQGMIVGRLKDSVRNLVGSYASIYAVGAGMGAFFRIGKEFQSIEARMMNASGGAQQMGKDMAWLTGLARTNGQALLETANSYAKFGSATSSSGFGLTEQKQMFRQITEINTAYQLTPDNAKLASLAVEQMVSKGRNGLAV